MLDVWVIVVVWVTGCVVTFGVINAMLLRDEGWSNRSVALVVPFAIAGANIPTFIYLAMTR